MVPASHRHSSYAGANRYRQAAFRPLSNRLASLPPRSHRRTLGKLDAARPYRCDRNLCGQSPQESRGCRVARQPIRDSKRAATALNPRGLPCERVSAPPATAHGVYSAAAADTRFSSAVVDHRLAQTSFNRSSMPPVTALVRCVREGREGALSPTTTGKCARNSGRLDLT
jgi:hypothetical protein